MKHSYPLLIVISLFLWGCSGRDTIKQEYQYVADHVENNPELIHHTLSVKQHTLHYVAHGDMHKPALIIVHGTPGSWRQYARYLLNEELLKSYYMIVVDRPGWGESVLGEGLQVASFELQAEILAGLAKRLREQSNNQPVVIMGHSLGASLAPRVAMDYPELIDGLLLFAGTISPDLASPRWFNYLGNVPLSKYVIGDRLHLSNQEIFDLQDNIDAMAGRWHEVNAQVIAVQGMKDGLVYPKNIAYIEQQFNPQTTKVVRLKDQGHLFPMTMRDEVVGWAMQLLASIKQ